MIFSIGMLTKSKHLRSRVNIDSSLFFYSRLTTSILALKIHIEVTENNAIFVSEKFPGLDFLKNNLKMKGESMVIAFIIGLLLGGIITAIGVHRLRVGTIRIARDEGGIDYPYLEFNSQKDKEGLSKRKLVLMRVAPGPDLSRH